MRKGAGINPPLFRVSEVLRGGAAVLGTFAAHFGATAAVVAVVLVAFLGAGLAGGDAEPERGLEDRLIVGGPAGGNAVGGGADVRAVRTAADALPHIAVHRAAGVGAGIADRGAVHGVAHGLGEMLVLVTGNVRVFGDHGFDGHGAFLHWLSVQGERVGEGEGCDSN